MSCGGPLPAAVVCLLLLHVTVETFPMVPLAAPMTKADRAALQVAAVVGAMLGAVTGYLLSNLVESGGWLKILIWAIIGAVVVSGMVFSLRTFRS